MTTKSTAEHTPLTLRTTESSQNGVDIIVSKYEILRDGKPISYSEWHEVVRQANAAPETAAERDRLRESNAELADALQTWMKFFDTMPKEQFWKISCDIGLMNEGFIKGFIKSRTALARHAKAEGRS